MSEDIDLILNWKKLGEEYNLDIYQENDLISNTQIEKFKKNISLKTQQYLENEFVPNIKTLIKNDLGYEVNVYLPLNEVQVVNIDYPKLNNDSYLLQEIRLEIGSLAAFTPTVYLRIKPEVKPFFESLFTNKVTEIETVSPVRTFWEKATILYRETQRPRTKTMPIRYSRHYYDLYMSGHSTFKDEALNNINLLTIVCNFKDCFYKESWMKYRNIFNEGIRLIPDDYRIVDIKEDYQQMSEMIYGPSLRFDEILLFLKGLEKEINKIILSNKK